MLARRGALAIALSVAVGGCWPDVQEEAQGKVDSTAAGGTQNRDNTQAGINSTIAPPGQGSALSDTAAGRLPSAGVSGPTQGLSGAAPDPRNANAQTRSQTADTTRPAQALPKAPATPAPRTP
jgi:hypothetical protein